MGSYEGLQPGFAARLRQLIEASGGAIDFSGYRSEARQAEMFAAAVRKYGSEAAARRWVAPPGKSNHGRGIAADLTGDLALAHRLAPQFGLYFPMSWEDWHIEPLGSRDEQGASYAHEPDAYVPDPATGNMPVEPDRHDLGIQLVAAFGMMSDQASGILGEAGDTAGVGMQDASAMNVQQGAGTLLAPNATAALGPNEHVEDPDGMDPGHQATVVELENQRQLARGAKGG